MPFRSQHVTRGSRLFFVQCQAMETDLYEIECSMSPEQRRALKRFDENQAEQRRLFLKVICDITHKEHRVIGTLALPPELNTEEARRLWKKAQEKGWVDARCQPLLSRSQAALLAAMMAKRLGIAKKWKVFENLWERRGIRGDYNHAMNQRQSLNFQDDLRNAFGTR